MKTKTKKQQVKKTSKHIAHTDITVVLDRSGSMDVVRDDTIGGFNRFLQDQKKAPGKANISLHQFDNIYETVINNEDIQSAKELTREVYIPRASTALLDAIGRSIRDTEKRMVNGSKIVFVIVTDGFENASLEFNRSQIFDMITKKREEGWEFVFLGANQDAIQVGMNLGVSTSNAMTYAHNAGGTKKGFEATSSNLMQMRCCSVENMSYSSQQRKDQEEEL